MILTVTLNPLLERRFYIDKLAHGGNHRAKKYSLSAGGKGINVSRQLDHLNTANLAYTFLGGSNGKTVKTLLTYEKINFTFIQTKNETRDGAVIIEEGGSPVTTVFGTNQVLLQQEVEEFKIKLRKIIENCEIVVFAGSSPSPFTDEIFPFGIECANELDKISILDTYGNHLSKCLMKGPTIIHNNLSELTSSLQKDLSSEEKIISLLKELYSLNIKQAYITDGSQPVYASNFDFHYRIGVPAVSEIDSTGSGDAFTAGIAHGLHNALTFEETLKNALSLGVLNASRTDVCRVQEVEIEPVKDRVVISSIGKKIKNTD